MLIPLGILAASGAAAGSYEHIETYTVGAGGIASVTFNVGSYITTYQHLQIRAIGRISTTTGFTSAYIRFNGDTAGNYAWHELVGNGSTAASYNGVNSNEPYVWRVPGGSADSNAYGAAVIDILDPYETTKNKTVRSLSGISPSIVQLSSAHWRNTAAVTSITFTSATGNFVQGTRVSIYGLKAS